MNRLITFEGIEGSGKSTQIQLAGRYLEKREVRCLLTSEPGGTPLGSRIRDILLNRGPYQISAEAELFLFLAARAQHVREVIGPALEEGAWVLCDRFLDATLAYQGWGRGLDIPSIQRMHDIASGCITPSLTIILDLPVETGIRRAMERISKRTDTLREDRFEQEDPAFHERIRQGYLSLAQADPRRFRVIDASRDKEAVQREISAHLATLFGR